MHTFNLTEDNCPMVIRLFERDEFHVNVPSEFPVSFANWSEDVEIEVEASKIYGPYDNKNKVFGMYFGSYESMIKITSNVNSQIVLGCRKNNDINELHHPGGYAKPVGTYERDYKQSEYPILFTDDQGLSKIFTIGVSIIAGAVFLAVCICMCVNSKCSDLVETWKSIFG